VALLTLDPEALERFVAARGLLVGDPAALVRHPALVARVGEAVADVNRSLPSYARIKRFAVLAGQFTEETGELTPTQKVKRRAVAERHAASIEALYAAPAAA
jgi:long-chain acyl-CoA synthetase